MKVVTVCGTRPELIKLAPLVPLLRERFEHSYVFTGQHYSANMVQVFVDELEAPAPDRFLDVGHSGLDALTAATTTALEEIAPDAVVVYGDTNSTLAGARAARACGARLLHVEAGIRSFDRSMPEEINRIEVDELADLRLAPTGLATWFLTGLEGHSPSSCLAVGNLVVDAWQRHRHQVLARPLAAAVAELEGPYGVLTLHRQATVDDPDVLARALSELGALDLPLFFPVHPRTAGSVERFGLKWPANFLVCEPIGYLDFCRAMASSTLLLTDSGGVQEEAITLGIPCVTLRPNTERMETVFLGANRLFDLARDRGLAGQAQEILAGAPPGAAGTVNPYGSGHAAPRIVALLEMLGGCEPTATFPQEQGFAGVEELRRAVQALDEEAS